MTEIRIRKDHAAWRQHGWTAIPNALLLDATIPWDCKGAFGWLSLAADDPEFDVTAASLAAAGPRGRDHAEKLIRTLEQYGWLTRIREQGAHGRPVVVYHLHPQPAPPETRTFRPSTAKPRRGAFSQVRPESLNVQALGADLGIVDNSPHGGSAPADTIPVFAGQARIPERAGPGRSGPGRSGRLTVSTERQKLFPPSDSLPAAAPVDGPATEGGRDDSSSMSDPEPSEEAVAEVARLDWRRHPRPSARRMRHLAQLLDQAVCPGRTLRDVRVHAQAAIDRATSSPYGYLTCPERGALTPEHLPAPRPAAPARRTERQASAPVPAADRLEAYPWCGSCLEHNRRRQVQRPGRKHLDLIPCPECHPEGRQAASGPESHATGQAGIQTRAGTVPAVHGDPGAENKAS